MHHISLSVNDAMLAFPLKSVSVQHEILVSWSPPSQGMIKINVDGSVNNNGYAGFGGLFCDSQGDCLMGFKGSIGQAPILLVEFKAIQHGLILAWQEGYKKVLFESHCLEAVRLITRDSLKGTMRFIMLFGSTIADIRNMLNWD